MAAGRCLARYEIHTPSCLFSSHFSRTPITDTESQSRHNSPTVQHSKTRPVSRDGPIIRRKNNFRRFFDNMKTSTRQNGGSSIVGLRQFSVSESFLSLPPRPKIF